MDNESTWLLGGAPTGVTSGQELRQGDSDNATYDGAQRVVTYPVTILPIALLSALAMAATAATQLYSYGEILCQDSTNCQDEEKKKYSGSVASATFVANILSLLALGMFENLAKRNPRAGLAIWTLVRAMSAGALILGVSFRNIAVALSSQMFEGLASDNILHFNLNAIYVQHQDSILVPRLIGISLALYMVGISVSPSLASILPTVQSSFAMAILLFGASSFHLLVGVRTHKAPQSALQQEADHPAQTAATLQDSHPSLIHSCSAAIRALASSIRTLFRVRVSILPALALLLYNAVQSYAFSAIMLQTSFSFGFSSRENGFLISIAHGVAAVYLFTTYTMVPKIREGLRRAVVREEQSDQHSCPREAYLALISIAVQAVAFGLFALANRPWQVYLTVALFSLGLAFPSFVKSYFVTLFRESPTQAMASLAVMESIGSTLAPLVFGGIQTIWPEVKVFYVGSLVMAIAWVLLGAGILFSTLRAGFTDGHVP
ncbi:MAG: hypothetical protein Q9165_008262 [Trypethelium subeluteriae]